jgi:hypothetical protein
MWQASVHNSDQLADGLQRVGADNPGPGHAATAHASISGCRRRGWPVANPLPKAPPVGIAVQVAACRSSLRPELRHLLMVMAVLADRRTGAGRSSQATIATAMGRSERHVRRLLAELELDQNSPVEVTRRYRSRSNGRGRSSDEYVLRVRSTGSPCAVDCSDQPDGGVRGPAATKRTVSADQPDTQHRTNRTGMSGDPGSGPDLDPDKAARADAVAQHYVAEFRRTRGESPPFKAAEQAAVSRLLFQLDGDAVRAARVISAALADPFRGSTATIRSIAADPAAWLGPPRAVHPRSSRAFQPQGTDPDEFDRVEAAHAPNRAVRRRA